MCELLAISARYPTTIRLSIAELARHGGDTGPHRDGWGVGFVQDRDALVIREPTAAATTRWLPCIDDTRADAVIAHIRRATQGERMLRNTQPFARELGGHIHLFAHNGMLPGIERDDRLATRRFRRVGDTDSEQAFCALLERIAPHWDAGVPPLELRLALVAEIAAELRALGPANFLYSDGDAIFAHAHRRRHDDGTIRPPGLHVLCRSCSAHADGVGIPGIELPPTAQQEVALLASVPLTGEGWQALAEGEVVVLQRGRIVSRLAPAPHAGRDSTRSASTYDTIPTSLPSRSTTGTAPIR
ncbi:MAG TPA: class II glutamine amidotransferase [Kofleriaceae bacterium]|nr:class II glutamine amidotransferase [Kofleriaceae bacterium]